MISGMWKVRSLFVCLCSVSVSRSALPHSAVCPVSLRSRAGRCLQDWYVLCSYPFRLLRGRFDLQVL